MKNNSDSVRITDQKDIPEIQAEACRRAIAALDWTRAKSYEESAPHEWGHVKSLAAKPPPAPGIDLVHDFREFCRQ